MHTWAVQTSVSAKADKDCCKAASKRAFVLWGAKSVYSAKLDENTPRALVRGTSWRPTSFGVRNESTPAQRL
eukprot:scaffold1239_cov175-Pinguiococcus_pyrenoidosus.AAC.52